MVNQREEGIDVGIRIGALEDPSLVAQPVSHLGRVVVASPDYLREHGTPAHPKDLRQANCVRFMAGGSTGWTFQDNGKALQVPVSGNLDFNQAGPAVEACAAGLGFGRFISYQVAPWLSQNKLRLVLETFEPTPRPISIIYPHARLLPARTRAFIDAIKTELACLPALHVQ